MPRPGDPDGGGPRPLLQARAPRATHIRVARRANTETGGNESELIRRLIEYGLPRMPPGWVPEEDDHPAAVSAPAT